MKRIALILLLLGIGTTFAQDAQRTPETGSIRLPAGLKIMPLGDSITSWTSTPVFPPMA